jgi:hypothetical protein
MLNLETWYVIAQDNHGNETRVMRQRLQPGLTESQALTFIRWRGDVLGIGQLKNCVRVERDN